MDEWVKCSDRMPKPERKRERSVLITGHAWPAPVVADLTLDPVDGTPSCWSDKYQGGAIYWLDDVTHWMLLPAQPSDASSACPNAPKDDAKPVDLKDAEKALDMLTVIAGMNVDSDSVRASLAAIRVLRPLLAEVRSLRELEWALLWLPESTFSYSDREAFLDDARKLGWDGKEPNFDE